AAAPLPPYCPDLAGRERGYQRVGSLILRLLGLALPRRGNGGRRRQQGALGQPVVRECADPVADGGGLAQQFLECGQTPEGLAVLPLAPDVHLRKLRTRGVQAERATGGGAAAGVGGAAQETAQVVGVELVGPGGRLGAVQ